MTGVQHENIPQNWKKLLYGFLVIFGLAVIAVVVYLSYLLFLYTKPNPWLSDPIIRSNPEVQRAKVTCQSSAGHFDCVVEQAIQFENPNICALTSIFVDDACLDQVWRAVNDPAICDQLYLEPTRPNCAEYFQNQSSTAVP